MQNKNSKSHWQLFSAAVRDGRMDEARRLVQSLVKIHQNAPKIWRWWLKLAETDEERLTGYRNLMQLEPQKIEYRHRLIRLLFNTGVRLAKSGEHKQADQNFQEACLLHPNSEKIWYWRAFVASNNQIRAQFLERVLEINPEHAQAKTWMDRRQSQLQEAHESWSCPICQESYQEEQTECTQCGVVLDLTRLDYILGSRAIDENLIHMGITNLTHRALNGHRFENRFNIGVAYLNLKQWEKALEVFLDIRPIDPENENLNHILTLLQSKALEEEDEKMPPPRHRGTVMIVDDSTTVRKLVSITVEDLGFQVIEAANGSQALSQIFEKKPDVVFLDIKMPQMDGYQVCRILKENKHTADIPIIMLTGQDGFFDRVRGKMVGAMDYITKPFDAETLVTALEKHFSTRIRHGN